MVLRWYTHIHIYVYYCTLLFPFTHPSPLAIFYRYVYVHCLSYFLSHPHSTTTCPSQLLHYYCYCCWYFLHLLSFYLFTRSTFPHIPNKFKLFTPSTCYVGKLGIKSLLLLLLLLLLLPSLYNISSTI